MTDAELAAAIRNGSKRMVDALLADEATARIGGSDAVSVLCGSLGWVAGAMVASMVESGWDAEELLATIVRIARGVIAEDLADG